MAEEQPPKSPGAGKDDAQKKRVRARQATLVGMPTPTAAELGKKVSVPKVPGAAEPKTTVPLGTPAKAAVKTAAPAAKAPIKKAVVGPKSSEPLETEPTHAAAKAPEPSVAEAKTEPPPPLEEPKPKQSPLGALPKAASKKDAPLTPVAVPRSLPMKSPQAAVEGLASRPRVITKSKSTEPLATEPTQSAAVAPKALREDLGLAKTLVPELAGDPPTDQMPAAPIGDAYATQEMKPVDVPDDLRATHEMEFDIADPLGAGSDELPGEPTQVGAKTDETPSPAAVAEQTHPEVEMPAVSEPPSEPPPPAPLPVEPTVVVHPSATSVPAQTYAVDMRSGSVQLAPATDPPPAKKSSSGMWIALGAVALVGILGAGTAAVVYVLYLSPDEGPVSRPLPRDPEPAQQGQPEVAVVDPAPPALEGLPPPAAQQVPREQMVGFELDRPRMSPRSSRMTRQQRLRATARPRLRAQTLLRAGQDAQAEAVFRDVLTIMPADGDSLEGLALATLRQGRYPEARAWAQAAVDRTRSATAYRLLGDAWSQAGHPDEARLNYEAGRLLHPNDRQLRQRLGLP